MAAFFVSCVHMIVATILLSYLDAVGSFAPAVISFSAPQKLNPTCSNPPPSVVLHAAGMGMAAASTKKKKKGGKKKKKQSSAPFDANASLMKLEKLYDELSLANAKAIHQENDDNDAVMSEYVISARATDNAVVADWVPIAQMCVVRPLADAEASDGGVADPVVQATLSQYCRELFHAATLGAPVFRSLARNRIQYSVESLDSFHKHVYEPIVETNFDNKASDEVMTKSEARSVLKVDADENDVAVIKKAYRTLSFELHPDRFARSRDESKSTAQSSSSSSSSATEDYAQVKLAYDTLSSGVRNTGDGSWYASLGGRARTEFLGPVSLLSLDKSKEFLSRQDLKSAVVGLDPEVVQSFVVRSCQ